MQTTQISSVLVILIVMIFTCDSFTPRMCRNRACNEQCNQCRWGTVWNDLCNFDECAQGPGDLCNENLNECAETLQCRCGRCHGCSNDRVGHKCHTSPCLPAENYDWPQFLTA